MFTFDTSLSSLRASQLALSTIAHNIANANTPGYSRQQITLAERQPVPVENFLIGWGVEVSDIRRVTDQAINAAITRNVSQQFFSSQSLDVLRRIESRLSPGANSLQERIDQFFDEAVHLQNQPADRVQRLVFLGKAEALTLELNQIDRFLVQESNDLEIQLKQGVSEVNQRIDAIFRLNRQIRQEAAQGLNPNDTLDRHQQLVDELAEWIDLEAIPDGEGFVYRIAGRHMASGETAFQLEAQRDSSGQLLVLSQPAGVPIEFNAGRLAAWQRAGNDSIPAIREQLDALALALASGVDGVHSTGLPLSGPYASLTGRREVTSTTAPLAESAAPFALTPGSLFVSITHTATQTRTLTRIDVDPRVQSLADLAAALSATTGLQAVVNSDQRTLSLVATSGYTFDFAGRPPTEPDRTALTGDAVIRLGGQQTGDENRRYTARISGSGTVGLTDGLTLRVEDESGALVEQFAIGKGYEPGALLLVPGGLEIRVESGTLNDGDLFTLDGVTDADTTGVLVGLGLGTFFQGSSAGSLRVDPLLTDDPDRLALSRDGQPGDGSNAARLAALRSEPQMAGGLTFTDFTSATVTAHAHEVYTRANEQEDLETLGTQLANQRAAVSGVDPNEELVRMMQFQRSFEASVRVISTLDEVLAELINILN